MDSIKMSRHVYDDDKCQAIWSNLVLDSPYEWSLENRNGLPKKSARNLAEILNLKIDELVDVLGSNVEDALKLRTLLSAVLTGDDEARAVRAARWIVGEWGGITAGLDSVAGWFGALRPFDATKISNFVNVNQTNRISSWSKILAFLDHNKYAIFDSRTSLALNSAMIISGLRPQFFMPVRKSEKSSMAFDVIKSKSVYLIGGFDEYVFLLQRFVELHLADSILDAERRIFAGADATAQHMIQKLR